MGVRSRNCRRHEQTPENQWISQRGIVYCGICRLERQQPDKLGAARQLEEDIG